MSQSKVTKRSWVLKECVERVPETFAAARGLLQFGLQETDIEILISVAEGEKHESMKGMGLKGLSFLNFVIWLPCC